MQSVLKKSGRTERAIVAIALLLFACLWFAGPAFAGADTTFDTALTKFTDFLEGSGGKIITVLSLAGGIVALARSEEHTSELQSLMRISYAVFCLKKKQTKT